MSVDELCLPFGCLLKQSVDGVGLLPASIEVLLQQRCFNLLGGRLLLGLKHSADGGWNR